MECRIRVADAGLRTYGVSMRVVILQPSYLPWLGCFDQIHRSDVFVFYDDVQFDKNGWRNRNRIKTPKGPQWLTIPVQTSGRFGQTIRDTMIDNQQPWADKHRRALETNYRRAPHFAWAMGIVEPILRQRWELLADLDIELTLAIARALGLGRRCCRTANEAGLHDSPSGTTLAGLVAPRQRFVRSSELGIAGGQTERLVRICTHFGATEYLSGAAAKSYLDITQFQKAEIRVEFQEYVHPEYAQLHGAFEPHLSIVDLMMNAGQESANVLRAGMARASAG